MTTIAAVLRFALVEKEDVPQICRYRKESLGNGVSEHQAWKILAWDLRWDHFSYRHKKLMSDADKLGDDLDDEYKQVRAFSRSHRLDSNLADDLSGVCADAEGRAEGRAPE